MNKAEGMIYSKMRGENMKDNIALIGFMGSGKTTIGRLLAKALDMKYIDIIKNKLYIFNKSKNIVMNKAEGMIYSKMRGENMKDNIALIGFMGSGKTTIGRLLAKALDMKYIDIDREIERIEKRPVTEIYKEKGEDYFKDLERKIIAEESLENNIVISTGGDSIIDNKNIKSLKETSFVVYLNCSIGCIYERVKDKTHRPLLNVDNLYETIVDMKQ